MSKLIFYIFYKCLACVAALSPNSCVCHLTLRRYAFIQFFFSFFNGFSGQPCFNLLLMQLYNVVFTALPCLVFAIFDKDADDRVSMEHPELYRLGVEDGIFTRVAMLSWMVSGVYHSFIIFFFGYFLFAFGGSPFMSGLDGDLSQFGVLTFFVLVVVTNTRAGMIATTWTWLMPAALVASVFSFLIVASIVGTTPPNLNPILYTLPPPAPACSRSPIPPLSPTTVSQVKSPSAWAPWAAPSTSRSTPPCRRRASGCAA